MQTTWPLTPATRHTRATTIRRWRSLRTTRVHPKPGLTWHLAGPTRYRDFLLSSRSEPDTTGQTSTPPSHCRIKPYLDQGGALRVPRVDACARPQPWRGPAGRAPTQPRDWRRSARLFRHAIRSSGGPSSLAQDCPARGPPCLGRSLRSRRTRSATPNLDTASTRQGSAPIEEDGRATGWPEPEPARASDLEHWMAADGWLCFLLPVVRAGSGQREGRLWPDSRCSDERG